MKSIQKWKKLGRVFQPHQSSGESHAAVPIAEHMEGDLFKIFFSARDAKNRSTTKSIILDINKPYDFSTSQEQKALNLGQLGEFDDSGAMGSWITYVNGEKYFYYIGWNLGVTVPFRNSIGLAIDKNGNGFERYSPGPILDRTKFEPHFCASCCVLYINNKWRMWYLSCTGWFLKDNGKPEHRYHIKYAESDDGINWERNGIVAIDYLNDREIAISRPSVCYENGTWKMWFSYRSLDVSYRIGYAESKDGINWVRVQNTVLDVSSDGWDSQMVEYPFVFLHKGQRYMLYNGNDYGGSGFGLAKEELA